MQFSTKAYCSFLCIVGNCVCAAYQDVHIKSYYSSEENAKQPIFYQHCYLKNIPKCFCTFHFP